MEHYPEIDGVKKKKSSSNLPKIHERVPDSETDVPLGPGTEDREKLWIFCCAQAEFGDQRRVDHQAILDAVPNEESRPGRIKTKINAKQTK